MRPGAGALPALLLAGAAGLSAQEDPVALPDAAGHHLYLTPTARTHPAGTGTAGVFTYLLPFVGYAVSDDLHLGGAVWLLGLGDGNVWGFLTPKLRVVDARDVDVAVGVLSWFGVHLDRRAASTFEPGMAYAVATWEHGPVGLTGGLGRGFESVAGPTFLVGGAEVAVDDPSDGGGIKLMLEAFGLTRGHDLFFDGSTTGILTVRFHDPTVAFDVGVIGSRDRGWNVLAVPLLSVTVTF